MGAQALLGRSLFALIFVSSAINKVRQRMALEALQRRRGN